MHRCQEYFENKIKSIRKSREELLKSVEEADFFKDNDSKSSFVDSINRTTEEKLREYIMQFNVLRSNANIFNDLLNYYSDVKNHVEGAEEKLKTFASRPDVKALVKDAIKKYTQQKNKRSIATSAKTVKTARKVDVKKNLFKNIEKKKVDKKSNTSGITSLPTLSIPLTTLKTRQQLIRRKRKFLITLFVLLIMFLTILVK